MNKIRIGVIGIGVLGSYHVEKCISHDRAVCSGCFDRIPERARDAALRFGVRSYRRLAPLINASDALIVATPSTTHRALVLECLERGRHVLVEKPLARSAPEGEELRACARREGVVLHVGHSEAFNPAFRLLMESRPDPRFVEVHRLATFSERGTDVSVILDLMIHDLHLLRRLCGQMPRLDRIQAVGVPVISDDIDIANVRLTFPSGCVANLTASRISRKRMRKLRIFQKDNYFSCDLDSTEMEHYYIGPRQAGGGVEIRRRLVSNPEADALSGEQRAFIGAILQDGSHDAVEGSEAVEILRITDAIQGGMVVPRGMVPGGDERRKQPNYRKS